MQDGALRDETINWISRLLIWLCKLREGAIGVINYAAALVTDYHQLELYCFGSS